MAGCVVPVRARAAGFWVVACLLGIGFWSLAGGTYIPAKAWLAQELMQRAWVRAGQDVDRPVPWPWADTWPVARLRSESRDVDLIVLSGGSGRTLAFGPGHLSASSMPGEIGNTVIAGHRDTHFRFLRNIEKGELLTVESAGGRKHVYAVLGADIVDSRKGGLLLDTDAAMLTLVTCYPFETRDTGGPLRYIVTARLVL